MTKIPRDNHFIWIRYFAAISIMVSHLRMFDTYPESYNFVCATLTWLFPGVPTLFFISGFLVSLSLKRSENYFEYLAKRVLRIYPPMWACLFVTILALFLCGFLNPFELNWFEFVFWFVGQLTFFQVYHPSFLNDFGLGVINGPLWAIPLIFQFYIILPFLAKYDKRFTLKYGDKWIYMLLILLAIFNVVFHYFNNFHESTLTKILFLTLVCWGFNFTLGYYFQRNYNLLKSKNPFSWLLFLVVHIAACFILRDGFNLRWGRNDINPLLLVTYAMFILNFAFLPKSKSMIFNSIEKFIAKYDISFGLYVYHMIVFNFLFEFEIFIDNWSFRVISFFLATIIISILSMLFLEKPIKDNRDWLISKLP